MIARWLNDEKTGKRGASPTYSDLAIVTTSTMGSLFNLAGRQTQGFMESLLELKGVELSVLDHSTVNVEFLAIEVVKKERKRLFPRLVW